MRQSSLPFRGRLWAPGSSPGGPGRLVKDSRAGLRQVPLLATGDVIWQAGRAEEVGALPAGSPEARAFSSLGLGPGLNPGCR